MASRYAAFTWNPLGTQTQPLMRSHSIVCFHTMVGSLSGTRTMFKAHGYGGTESHFGVGEKGEGDQWQDLAHTADANYQGNPDVVSIENADYGGVFGKWNTGDASKVPAFTDAQVKRLIDLGYALALPGKAGYGSLHRLCPKNWDCYEKGIPAVLIPDTKPGRRGFGYHAQGVEGQGLVNGGVRWSTSYGKVCPGARRIKQVKGIIIPGIAARLAGKKEEDVALSAEDKKWFTDALRLSSWAYKNTDAGDTVDMHQMLVDVHKALPALLKAAQGVDVKALAAELAPLLSVATTPAELETVLRKIFGSLDNPTAEG